MVTPSRWFYLLAAGVLVGGMVFFGVFLLTQSKGLSKSITQISVPGTSILNLNKTGDYAVFWEHESALNDKVHATRQGLAKLKCELKNKETGTIIPLKKPWANTTYAVAGHSRSPVFDFTLAQPGAYEFSAIYPKNEQGPKATFAVGRGFTKEFMSSILRHLGFAFASGVLAVGIVLVTFFKRRKAFKAISSGMM